MNAENKNSDHEMDSIFDRNEAIELTDELLDRVGAGEIPKTCQYVSCNK